MKNFELNYLPGDEVWVAGQTRVSIIDQVILSEAHNGDTEVLYTWCNYDYGPDVTELWDDGEFTPEDIGKTVFDSLEDYERAFPEEFAPCEYEGDELRLG